MLCCTALAAMLAVSRSAWAPLTAHISVIAASAWHSSAMAAGGAEAAPPVACDPSGPGAYVGCSCCFCFCWSAGGSSGSDVAHPCTQTQWRSWKANPVSDVVRSATVQARSAEQRYCGRVRSVLTMALDWTRWAANNSRCCSAQRGKKKRRSQSLSWEGKAATRFSRCAELSYKAGTMGSGDGGPL